jgi:glycosyltransferase involved in cell wall biosynthesis
LTDIGEEEARDLQPAPELAGTPAPSSAEQLGADFDRANAALAVARRDRERAKAAQAQVLRERERARLALEKAMMLEDDLRKLQASLAWRLTWPVRRLATAVPPPLYAKLRRAPEIMSQRLKGLPSPTSDAARVGSPPNISASVVTATSAGAVNATAGRVVSGAACRPAALLVDDRWPHPDCDAGSIEIVNLADALLGLGFNVLYAVDLEFAEASRGRDTLASRGVRCIGPADAPSVNAFLERDGKSLELCVLNRVYSGGRFMEAVQRHCPSARILFNTIDLHWVRLEREARLRGDRAGLKIAAMTREREVLLAREADAVIVVSSVEQALLMEASPEAFVVELPLAREAKVPRAPFESRDGIGFIGGFKHAPNLDALQFFLREVWPLVLKDMPGCAFSVVGSDLPAGIVEGAPGAVRYLGHVPDIEPWFEDLRLTVAPLRYGAGLKGKVISSLAAGVPCVATSIAMEGITIQDKETALVADTPEGLAERIVKVHSDPALWSRLSAGGLKYVAEHLSRESWRRRLVEALWVLGVLPENAKT